MASDLIHAGGILLSVSGLEDDHAILARILGSSGWELRRFLTWREAADFLREQHPAVVICERDLPDGSWKDLLRAIGVSDCPPSLIVSSLAADDFLWAEVLNLGGCDVLAKPFQPAEVLWVATMAWTDFNNRHARSATA